MTYDPKTKTLRVRPEDMERAYGSLMWSLKNIRIAAGKPLDKYDKPGPLEPADFAMKGIIDAAEALGIEMDARWGNELDLRNVG
jgi:hypothetical protein